MTGRSIPLWVGSTPDAAIPTRVKLRVWARCEGRCAITNRKLGPTDPHDYDHIVPLHLGGVHGEANLQVVARDAHRIKSASEVSAKAKADRTRAKFLGIYPKSKTPLKSRGFAKTREWKAST